MRAILIGILSSLFFSATFIINRAMNVSGLSWAWTASLRYFMAIPILFIIVAIRGELKPLFKEIKINPFKWLIWGSIGNIGFYALLSFSSIFAPAWLTAGTWQITIIAGALLSPMFYKIIKTPEGMKKVKEKIPLSNLKISMIILLGVICMQAKEATSISLLSFLMGFIPVIIAAFFFPLGNRKMMEVVQGRLNTFQRSLGMAISSIPICIVLAIYGFNSTGIPNGGHILNTFLLALFSGVFATVLYYYATDMVKNQSSLLAAVESTQSGTMVFTVLGDILLLGGSMPSGLSLVGIILIIVGMIMNGLFIGIKSS
ncbi:hypothetical protein Curi_c07660 [Gottschalkia acidurici 9a]|uniref:Multidrug resistance efflux transporter family protein n=1 Tax=Gottschalkia acidurici (strain ATCC 7906 / DSM 604 / BCRC 14475 / CIP 104303 / KCTC 5404 / NCIMB 10678 / 9a) TaxID=1128398 RepID=K0AXA0_GOTA9|nr:multidrug resistance efflux transporter family protein [Gottschalkia acidurici]AFS77839.1 hypothetical protein Curi_c07660 [Gottschalkia acidurici 9a]